MFVVVRSSNGSRGAVEAVRGQAEKAGLGTSVFEGEGRSVVGLEGEVPIELRAILETIPGVEDVVGGEAEAAEAKTRDLRVKSIRPLEPPAILLEQLPLSRRAAATVRRAREEVVRVLNGEDDRLIVVVGPCSVHDPQAALDYARRLLEVAEELREDLLILMRVYFEKPRTTVGWKGLINDPHLDGSFDINAGLRAARGLLLEIAELGLPAGCEVLDPISPQFFSDVIAWSAIGARTTESQVHRDLASGLSMPVGFKNGTDGNIQIAIDALRAADYPHHFLGVTEQGLAAIVNARGNEDCHVILRGGKQTGTNFDAESVRDTLAALRKVGLPERVMIDTSHGNSLKDYRRQPAVASDIASQVAGGQRGIVGVLMESFLEDGAQDLTEGGTDLVYGQSVTDACMGWGMTVPVLRELAEAVRARRDR
ncbi:3-deoxy-7-phosphoheptulonate synthase [Rubrobacter marinus]|uniref:3-deoxy-7-phosphoheptulonate synthase n=1 Tax=Rubrobacter marinus TaxID=2653852 RepID=A0A6G8PV92_9ACTN|nr:3-deoxy-7-phosphoheptulonate synthase [Rubrobacter marinus]QIN78120.1 3-deoxy-7-phosphoheptulonate synthase [Rubrobacter marinus]